MAKSTANPNPVILTRGIGIGSGNAESDDDFLFDCFVYNSAVERCMKVDSAAMILAGRTGSGKTAILRHIAAKSEYAVTIDPSEMSMSYVSNSDALRFLNAIGADLDLLFQVLWKHVLCIEFIRLRWSIETTERSQSIFSRLTERFGKDDRRKKAIKYLQNWQGKFWITMDENIKEMTESVEKKLHAEIGVDIEKFKAGGQYDKRLSNEKKSEIVARTRNIISSDQLSELHSVIDMLSASENGDQMKTFFIMIDKLDEKWVDDSVRFRMIKALVESLKTFRKITNLKILVALRIDVIERVVQETADVTFQREKFEDNTARIIWSKGDMKDLVQKRISLLYRRRYTLDKIDFKDVFPPAIGNRDTFDWMIERTLMRPRDIIAFVNEAIDASDGKSSVSVTALRSAETEFARKRKEALIQEWRSCFPSLGSLLDYVGSKRKSTLALEELVIDVADLALTVCARSKRDLDPMFELFQSYIDGKIANEIEVVKAVVATLYRTGAIGVKLDAQDRFRYSHLDEPLLSTGILGIETKIRLHPMLHAAYHLQDRES